MEKAQHQTPRLAAALSSPLSSLESTILKQEPTIEAWFEKQWQQSPALFYSSVDLRNAGFKLAPVDANVFPAGFNNLSPSLIPLCVQAAQRSLKRLFPDTEAIFLIPENHSRNLFYLENLASLYTILVQTALPIKIVSLRQDFRAETLLLPSGRQLTIEPFPSMDLLDSTTKLVLLNNDLSSEIPNILKQLQCPVHPLPAMGWSSRLKSTHFTHYQTIANELADSIGIDPWLISPLFYHCDQIDFMKHEGEECLRHNTQRLLTTIAQKYQAHGITEKPFVVLKAESGTYGMAVMMLHTADEVQGLNRRKRSHMSTSKGGNSVSKVIIQEGIRSIETWNNSVAEPVLYTIGEQLVGGFYRRHPGKKNDENLNSPGMHFEQLPLLETKNLETSNSNQRFYVYGVVARLAALACARESKCL